MSSTIDLSGLQKQLTMDVLELVNHEFICELKVGTLDWNAVKVFAEQYCFVSAKFKTYLYTLAGRIESESARQIVINNLKDECGNGDKSQDHHNLYKIFLNRVQPQDEHLICKPSFKTKVYLDCMDQMFNYSPLCECLGSITFSMELVTPPQYTQILVGLKRFGFVEEELAFFYEHVSHDPRHTTEFKKLIHQLIEEREIDICPEAILFGAKKTILMEKIFWDGILETVRS